MIHVLWTMRRSEKFREIKARHHSLRSAHLAQSSAPSPFPIQKPSVPAESAIPILEHVSIAPQLTGYFKTSKEIQPRALATRQQGFLDDKKGCVEPEHYDASRYFQNPLTGVSNSALVTSFEALVQNLLKGATRSGCSISVTLENIMKREAIIESESTTGKSAQADCSRDVRTLYRQFDLDPKFTTYACCPLHTCSAIYPLPPELSVTHYPLRCTRTKFGISCNKPLMQGFRSLGEASLPKPIKPFYYHHFHDHVASMLARPGIEDAIQSHLESGKSETELTDITSSPTLRSFVDHSGRPFLRTQGDEIRLVWALSADWYNPRGNKASGKVVSTGVIAMMCLSLPPHLRNLEENIYLAGLIPGPQEPSVDATNHFLVPLINDLIVSYQRGVYYSRTHRYSEGRTSRSAIIPVIADTMASKKLTGNCSHSATHFCSRCRLHRDCIGNLDSTSWPPGLTRSQHQLFAEKWRDAESKTKQASSFKEHGIRWSPLLLLPYWQPSSWTITEAVHVVLLGLIPRHCRDLLGLNFKDLPSDDQDDDPPSPSQMEKAMKILESGEPGKLQSLSLNVLRFLCMAKGIPLPAPKKGRRTKREYVSALLGSVPEAPSNDTEDFGLGLLFDHLSIDDVSTKSASPSVPTKPKANPISKEMLTQIREDISSTQRPEWQGHLPHNFGCPEHGKLKADQWRTALEFDIPVSLIHIRHQQKPSGNIDADARLQKLVDHTLDLAMAVSWGLSRRTSPYHAERYTFYMKRYLVGIKELFPDYNLKPNHHYALHIPDILLTFGPLHGTWAFSVERLIGRLQKLNSNSKIGEMEVTAMSIFCRRQRLIHFITSDHCPSILKKAWAAIQPYVDLHNLDTGVSRKHVPGPVSQNPIILDDDVQQALSGLLLRPDHDSCPLNAKTAFTLQSYCVDGIAYRSFDKSPNHSLIYFHNQEDPSNFEDLLPGQIRLLFQHYRVVGKAVVSENFAAVHRYQPVQLANDPFAAFPEFRARIYEKEPLSKVTVIRATQIYCHANQRPWNSSSVVMRAIDRNY